MSKPNPRQLALDLSFRPAYDRENFLIASSNQLAVDFIDRWPDWPSSAALLIGPPGAGKTHLVEVWRRRSGASIVAADALDEQDVPGIMPPDGAVAVEDAPGQHLNQRALFHLLNHARECHGYVLITSQSSPRGWNLSLVDLISRLAAMPSIALERTDDALLRAVLVKLFSDRQIAIDEGLIGYLIARMPRSFEAARTVVAELDRRALEERVEVTKALVARVLAALDEIGLPGSDPN